MSRLKRGLRYASLLILLTLVSLLALNYRSDLPLDELKAKYANKASRFVAIEDLRVHYRDEGPRSDSVPIVMLHGTGASLLTWDGWVRRLALNRRVIRLDLPAYGLTGPNATHTYTAAYYTQFLRNFLTTLNVSRCDLAGNSLGGLIAWRYALGNPAAVRRLVLIDAAGYPLVSRRVPLAFQLAKVPGLSRVLTYITPRSVIEQSVRNVYADPNRVTSALIDQYMDMALRAGNRQAFVARMQTRMDDSTYRQIPGIRQRTLVLWGQQDGLIPVENAYRFHRDLPNDTLVIMPNAGHVPMEELPEESARIVGKFLANQR